MAKVILDITGHLFVAEGCEYGPTIMLRDGEWDEVRYQQLVLEAWCNNYFKYDFEEAWAKEVEPKLQPGKRYRLLIEEVE